MVAVIYDTKYDSLVRQLHSLVTLFTTLATRWMLVIVIRNFGHMPNIAEKDMTQNWEQGQRTFDDGDTRRDKKTTRLG